MKKAEGSCISCGRMARGAPAIDDNAILFFRKAREVLRMPRVHTLCCDECLPQCNKKREKFEKMRFNYRVGAFLFAALLLGGSAVMGGFSTSLLLPAIVGALFICCLPYFYYSPKFGVNEGRKK